MHTDFVQSLTTYKKTRERERERIQQQRTWKDIILTEIQKYPDPKSLVPILEKKEHMEKILLDPALKLPQAICTSSSNSSIFVGFELGIRRHRRLQKVRDPGSEVPMQRLVDRQSRGGNATDTTL